MTGYFLMLIIMLGDILLIWPLNTTTVHVDYHGTIWWGNRGAWPHFITFRQRHQHNPFQERFDIYGRCLPLAIDATWYRKRDHATASLPHFSTFPLSFLCGRHIYVEASNMQEQIQLIGRAQAFCFRSARSPFILQRVDPPPARWTENNKRAMAQ